MVVLWHRRSRCYTVFVLYTSHTNLVRNGEIWGAFVNSKYDLFSTVAITCTPPTPSPHPTPPHPTPPPLPAKAYTTLLPKFEKHPIFADFDEKKHPFSTEIADFEAQ